MTKIKGLLGPDTGYVDEFIEAMENDMKDYTFPKTPIRPSAAGNCTRELYYALREFHGLDKYPKPQQKGETTMLLDLGHHVEKHLIWLMRKHYQAAEIRYTQQVLSFKEIKAKNDPRFTQWVEGSMDLCFWSDKWKCAVDVKTKGDNYDWYKRKMKWDLDHNKLKSMKTVQVISKRAYWVEDLPAFLDELNDPWFAANFKQLNLYMNSPFLKERGIDHGAIIQYHKAKSMLREVRFKPSKELYDQVIKKFETVIEAVDTNNDELATRDFEENSFKCRYCPYSKICRK